MPELTTILHLTDTWPNAVSGEVRLLASEIAGVRREHQLAGGSRSTRTAVLMKGGQSVVVAESVEHVTDLWVWSIEDTWSA